jgi:hypothetical protein
MPKPITAKCGTRSAYKRHLRHGEKPCKRCIIANTQWHKEYRILTK